MDNGRKVKSKRRKILTAVFVSAGAVTVLTAITCILLCVALVMVGVSFVSSVDKTGNSWFGYSYYIAKTDAMSATHFDAGDVVYVEQLDDYSELGEGEVIAFLSTNPTSYGEVVIHMIDERVELPNGGQVAFVTKGTTTGVVDEALVECEYILGVYRGSIPDLGSLVAFLN